GARPGAHDRTREVGCSPRPARRPRRAPSRAEGASRRRPRPPGRDGAGPRYTFHFSCGGAGPRRGPRGLVDSKAVVFPSMPSAGLAGAPASWADVVVGTGIPASCTEAAFASAVATVNATGGAITFSCGGAKTITLTSQKVFQNAGSPNLVYTIDGAGLITLAGS